ncbi:SCO3374 family protein [Streptomyces sp. NPDC051133]|uniref:SCO3374 family protein n=1 Tax=Streptomyces sp. NPDC051133 TaxID=3155521 RepID=UPI00343094F8
MAGPAPTASAELPPRAPASHTVPLPRRPLDPETEPCAPPAGPDTRARHWYENDLGWATVPGRPLRLLTGVRFDVLDVPAEAGAGALRHLAPGSPVAVRGDRMELLVAAGSAEELPGLLDWLEWGGVALDLRALGAGETLQAPIPPVRAGGASADTVSAGAASAGVASAYAGFAPNNPLSGDFTSAESPSAVSPPTESLPVKSLPGDFPPPDSLPGDAPRACPVRLDSVAAESVRAGSVQAGSVRAESVRACLRAHGAQGCRGPFEAEQGAAVWLRPPWPGGEVEAWLPAMPAMGREGSAPDLVRLVDTVAAQCHRVRLRRACAGPSACRRDQPWAFS